MFTSWLSVLSCFSTSMNFSLICKELERSFVAVLQPRYCAACKFLEPGDCVVTFGKLHPGVCEYELVNVLALFAQTQAHRNRILAAGYVGYVFHLLISCMTVILRLTVRIALWNAETSPITSHSFLARVTAVYTIGRERRFI